MKKRFLSILMMAMMVCGSMPTLALAGDDDMNQNDSDDTSSYTVSEEVTVTNNSGLEALSGKFQGAAITKDDSKDVRVSLKVSFPDTHLPRGTYTISAQLFALNEDGQGMGTAIATASATNDPEKTFGSIGSLDVSFKNEGKEVFDLVDGERYIVVYSIEDAKGTIIVSKNTTSDPERMIVRKETLEAEGGDYEVSLGRVKDSSVPRNQYEYIAGAKMHLEKKNGERYDAMGEDYAWTSSDTPKRFTLGLGEYKVVEDEAPAGWTKAEDYTFKIDETFQAETSNTRPPMIRFKSIGGNGQQSFGYCLDYDKKYPELKDYYYGNNEDLAFVRTDLSKVSDKITNKNSVTVGELSNNLLRMTLVGYPNDKENIGKELGLTEEQFYQATQYAVWHFGGDDKVVNVLLKSSDEEVVKAYGKLISSTYEVSSDVKTNVLVPSNKNYQYLLTTSTVFAHVISSEQEKTPVSGSETLVDSDNKIATKPTSNTITQDNPNTGDHNMLALWALIMLLATLETVVLVAKRRRAAK